MFLFDSSWVEFCQKEPANQKAMKASAYTQAQTHTLHLFIPKKKQIETHFVLLCTRNRRDEREYARVIYRECMNSIKHTYVYARYCECACVFMCSFCCCTYIPNASLVIDNNLSVSRLNIHCRQPISLVDVW